MGKLPEPTLLEEHVRDTLSEQRFKHVQGVVQCAADLARRQGVDVDKAVCAAWLHDVAKEYSDEQLLKLAEDFGIILTEIEMNTPQLWHAIVGARLVRRLFDITDLDVLAAIRFHATGRADMSPLEKVVFLADVIEPSRSFAGVERLREMADDDFDAALLKALNDTIRHVVEREGLLHPDTVAARNDILLRRS